MGSQTEQGERIWRLVDEQKDAWKSKNKEKANSVQSKLRSMGVMLDNITLGWTAPGGLVGAPQHPGAWRCNACSRITFEKKAKCFHCGAPHPDEKGEKRGDSPSYGRGG